METILKLVKAVQELREVHKKQNELNGLYIQPYRGGVMGTELKGWKRHGLYQD